MLIVINLMRSYHIYYIN